ncbi:response regulator [Paenibacillus cellulositrophicus]|uniref:response regulator transcription factor n=1 Tax=Paenibacillus cellulositrophicus TaxID=562959 RepID=UPI00142F1782|nr:response regulator transcription factor [Paenibacillus cellulositrophicus]
MNGLENYSEEIRELILRENQNIKVLIADSDRGWQQRLAMLINSEPDMKVSGVVSTKETAIQASIQLQVDVMVLDIMLNSTQQEGLDTITEILHKKELPIIVLSSLDDREIIMDVVLAGTINFIRKCNYLDIISAVKEAFHGESSLHADAAKILRNEIRHIKHKELLCMLTRTEQDILKFIGWGYSQPIIRELLGVSSNTMKSHVRNIIRKFDTRTIREAAQRAKRRGFYGI